MRDALALLAFLSVWTAGELCAQCPDGTPPPCAGERAAAAARRNTIAVLPFENRSRDTADSYLAEGFAEELSNRLAQVPRLTVTSNTAVRRLRNATTLSAPAIGRALGAGYLVSGSVQGGGGRLRVSAELLRAAGGPRVWSSRYERGEAELLGVVGDVALAVAGEVVGRLTPSERARLASPPTANPGAYDLYLRGSRTMFDFSAIGLQQAIASFEAALALDPRFAAALGRLAATYAWAVNWDAPLPGLAAESIVARGWAASERALVLDSASADAWAGRGTMLFFRDPPDYAGAVAALGRAGGLDSTNAPVQTMYSVVLRRLGAFAASDSASRRARALEPGLFEPFINLAYTAFSQRRFEQARALLDSAIAIGATGPGFWSLRARLNLLLGDLAGASRDAERARRAASFPNQRAFVRAVLVEVQARSGDTVGARARVDSLLSEVSLESPGPRQYQLAVALAASGRTDAALDLLERIRPRGAWLWSYLITPDFDPVRANPRFARLIEECRPPGAPRMP